MFICENFSSTTRRLENNDQVCFDVDVDLFYPNTVICTLGSYFWAPWAHTPGPIPRLLPITLGSMGCVWTRILWEIQEKVAKRLWCVCSWFREGCTKRIWRIWGERFRGWCYEGDAKSQDWDQGKRRKKGVDNRRNGSSSRTKYDTDCQLFVLSSPYHVLPQIHERWSWLTDWNFPHRQVSGVESRNRDISWRHCSPMHMQIAKRWKRKSRKVDEIVKRLVINMVC